jgi:hypothetical protein
VHFNKSVSDFGDSDVALSGTAGATTATVTGSGQDYDVAVSGMTSNGTVTASIAAAQAHDAAGNGNTASTSTDNQVTYDATRPSVTINQAATQSDPTSVQPILFTVVFSEVVTGFGNASTSLAGSTAGGSMITNVYDSGDHKTYTVKVSGMTTAGTVVASINANQAQDAAGNQNTASTSTDNSVTWQPSAGGTPTVTIISPTFGSVYAKGSASINPLTLQAKFSDSDDGPWTYSINWDDNGATSSGTVSGTTATDAPFSATHPFLNPGVYTINVKVTDSASHVGTASVWIVVYDPNGGFVTGGGWINVGAGSSPGNPSLAGRANFGFNSQYKKNAAIPTGETEFNFQVGNLNFHSTAYSWLVVSNFKAQYKGTGTINGAGKYSFTLTAYDGDITGGGGVDKFRIQITDDNNHNAVVFDNRNGTPIDIDAADPQAIAGGSIVIHKA